jgi:polyphenol oxidase
MIHPDWIIPDWPAPPNVRAIITTRAGGTSRGPYESLNLGLRAGDDEAAVRENRARLLQALPHEPKWLAQVHGATVVEADGLDFVPAADASVARAPGTVCAVMIADCMPVLLCDTGGTTVAVAHAGWRGLAAGVVENTVGATRIAAHDLIAYLGPCISPQTFEVGADVHDAIVARDPAGAAAFEPLREGKWLADLYALARQALARAGVTNIHGGGWCTYTDARRFFSYRRDKSTGRMAALLWRES